MPVTTSYPGVYVEELPSLVHSITPAPTSVAVFVGYTHPFATPAANYLTAIQLFSFADYRANFGGFFYSPWLPDYVGQAVYQFFLNGGQTCYVVGLPAQEYYEGGQPIPPSLGPVEVKPASLSIGGITFTARQPVGLPAVAAATPSAPAGQAVGIQMQVAFSNIQSSTPSNPHDTADIVISYGTVVETYRKVQIATLAPTSPPQPPSPLQNSNLVTVSLSAPAPTGYPSLTGSPYSLTYQVPPAAGWTTINPGDFAAVFEEYASLDKVPVFNLLATPGITASAVTSEAVAYCERKRAFYIMDTPSPSLPSPPLTTPPAASAPAQPDPAWNVNSLVGAPAILSEDFPVSINAALYYPWLLTTNPITGAPATAPPSGFVAGMYGQEDNARGVWKSPAGIETALLGTTGVDPNGLMNDAQQGVLNQNALDCIRQFPGIGTVIFGARTTAGADANTAQQQWKYVSVRRMALFIEQTLYSNLTWAVFEGNAAPLWNALTQEVTAFMLSLFRQGAFAGDTPTKAFLVQCDSTTTTPADVANGVVNILVGFAPLVPAEFVIVQIAQLAGQAQS
jgi:Bacteriophage tail sheath protein